MSQRKLPKSAFQLSAPLQLEGKKAEGEGDGVRLWSGVAYTGAPVTIFSFDDERLVIDLETMQGIDGKLPALVGHDRDRIAGYAEKTEAGESLQVSGRLLQSTEHGQMVAGASDEGFPWQLSIDARPGRIEEVKAGTEVTVNGRKLSGPLVVFRDTRVAEVSFTPTGVDYNTTAAALSDDFITVKTENEDDTMTRKNDQAHQASEPTAEQMQQLQQQLADEQTARQQAEQQLADERRDRRKASVQSLFEDMGREYTDEAAEPYVQMSDAAFNAVAEDMRKAKGSQNVDTSNQPPAPPDGNTLLSDQAQGAPADSSLLSDDQVVDAIAQL